MPQRFTKRFTQLNGRKLPHEPEKLQMKIFLTLIIVFQGTFGEAQVPVTVRSPTEKMKFYPCSKCHRPSSSLRNLNPHRKMEFKHMPEVKECFMCHGHQNPDTLVLLDEQSISYEQVPLLCGQCHGLKKGEWEKGLHGRLEGNWQTQKIKPICIECHDAHKPKFPKIKAFPPPQLPKLGKKKGESQHEMDSSSSKTH